MLNPIKQFVKKFATHRQEYYKDRLFRRVNEKKLIKTLEFIGLESGQTLYIQSAFGSLGYYPDGGVRFINLLKDIVGPRGTIVMPCFPTNGAMQDYVIENPSYNALTTPSKIGLLPEIMRSITGARRSCHPTHSVVTIGYLADDIVAGHENCPTPQGENSPFDKLVHSGTRILRIGTPANPLTHRLQEIVEIPNLFLKKTVTLNCVSDTGKNIPVTTKVYRKKIPFVLFLTGTESNEAIGTNIIDMPILFEAREQGYKDDDFKRDLLPLLLRFRKDFENNGLWKHTCFNGCHMDTYPADVTMDFAVKKIKEMIRLYSDSYQVELISRALDKGEIKL